MPAMEPPKYVRDTKTCPYCGSINNCRFKNFDNKMTNQPRYQCLAPACKKHFTYFRNGSRRITGNRYPRSGAKELEHLKVDCPRCGAAKKYTRFKCYNNTKRAGTGQPCFECRKCKRKFQTWLIVSEAGEEPHLSIRRPRNKRTKRTLQHMPNTHVNRADEVAEVERKLLSAMDSIMDETATETPADGELGPPEWDVMHPSIPEDINTVWQELSCILGNTNIASIPNGEPSLLESKATISEAYKLVQQAQLLSISVDDNTTASFPNGELGPCAFKGFSSDAMYVGLLGAMDCLAIHNIG